MLNHDFNWIVLTGHSSLESGGVGTHLRVLVQELEKSNLSYRIILGKSKLQAISQKLFLSLGQFFGTSLQDSAFFLHIEMLSCRLKSALKRLQQGLIVVHCHDFASLLSAIAVRSSLKFKFLILYTVHAPFAEQFLFGERNGEILPEIVFDLEHRFFAYVDGFIFVDILQQEIVKNKFLGLNDDRCLMLPNAINIDIIEPIRHKAKQKRYIVVARHLYKKCGVHIAIEAFSKANIPKDIRLVIIGEGDQKNELICQVKSLGLADRVDFLGKMPHMKTLSIISEAMLSLVPSIPIGNYIEATSLTMLESMALGVPLIASNIGGLKQVLSDTNAGILVPHGDSCHLASAIENVVKNQKIASELSQNSIKLIELKYSSFYWFNRQIEFVISIINGAL